MKICIIHLFLV